MVHNISQIFRQYSMQNHVVNAKCGIINTILVILSNLITQVIINVSFKFDGQVKIHFVQTTHVSSF